MNEITLNTTLRSVVGKQVKALRRAGQVPIVLYGRSIEPMLLQAEAKELMRVLRRAGFSRLISVNTNGDSRMALAREVQREPVSGALLHLDLLAVSMTESITIEVPVVLEGESPAVRQGLGVVMTGLTEIEIEALPGDLIDRIRIDLSRLKEVGDQITVADLVVPDTITVLSDADEMVARITYATIEKEEEAPAGEEAAEPEVIAKGKAEEDEDEDEEEE
jgi:large subunit ribosomal protein L25